MLYFSLTEILSNSIKINFLQATWVTAWGLKYNFICQELVQDESPQAKEV